MREIVEHFADARLADYHNIPDPRLLAERNVFVAEGRLVVARLLTSERFATRSLLVTRAAAESLAEPLARRADVPVFEVSQHTMDQVAGFRFHRGCLAIGERPPTADPAALVASARRLLALEGLGNPDNVGGIFRNAAALGADGVLLDEASVDPLYRKSVRTSMGAVLQVPFARTPSFLGTLARYRASGARLVALTPDPAAQSIDRVAADLADSRLVLIVGHEGRGIEEATRALCDVQAHIPMQPGVDSLNVVTAVGIALYAVGRRDRTCA